MEGEWRVFWGAGDVVGVCHWGCWGSAGVPAAYIVLLGVCWEGKEGLERQVCWCVGGSVLGVWVNGCDS